MYKHIDKNNQHLQLLSGIADPVRMQIVLYFAGKGPECVGDIAKHFTISRQTVSHHLQIMERAGVLSVHKKGREIFYKFEAPYVIEQLDTILNVLKTNYK